MLLYFHTHSSLSKASSLSEKTTIVQILFLPSFSTFVFTFATLPGLADAMKVGNLTLMLTKSVQCHHGTSFTVSHGGCVTYAPDVQSLSQALKTVYHAFQAPKGHASVFQCWT
ncbi:hypothetical protein BDV40DRAFT_164260 [Aspergillus tamarii]|uniref:Uncharacterized protein n=1 Tax=Aspergillus tamarii TaxID=41984 RepID=A0A5N6UU99_ASPTM|nr:hypothetical protein BDV40DRAFT_164260 [Aspergillus tamarii]